MSAYLKKERRRYPRYNTEVKIYFHVDYELKTKVTFKVLADKQGYAGDKKYAAISRDVSAEGLKFTSDKKLKKGDILYLEVYIPKKKKPIHMTGEVRWSKNNEKAVKAKFKFDTGIRLLTVEGVAVPDAVCFDKDHGVIWSPVLDSIFGSFRKLMQKRS